MTQLERARSMTASPEVGHNDVLIRIKRTAICGTDIHIWKWDEWAQKTIPVPMHVGHEYVGEIVEMGQEVRGFAIGDRVSGEGHITCGFCRNCRAGRRHLCRNTVGVGVNREGAFAEYLVIPGVQRVQDSAGNLRRSRRDLRSVRQRDAYGAVVQSRRRGRADHRRRADRHHGRGDRETRRRTQRRDYRCQRLPARTRAQDGRDACGERRRARSLRDVMAELHMTEGFDVGLEMSGVPSAFTSLLEAMNHGGKVALLGIPPAQTAIDWNQVIFKGLEIKGIYGREMFETWYKMVAMLQSGLDLSPILTHTFPVDDYERAFATMLSGESGKVILDWTV